MTDAFTALAGTPQGENLALILALIAAFLHAIFGALQKGKQDPWLVRGSIDFSLIIFGLPMALFLVPAPQGMEWALLGGAFVIHFFYKVFMALAYDRGAFTVVYPVVRGGGVLFAVIGAWLVFDEAFNVGQWAGVLVLVAGIFGLAAYNLRHLEQDRNTLVPALGAAMITALTVAIYTTYDAYGIRATANPFTFLLWFFVITSLDFPVIAYVRYRRMENPPALRPLLARGAIGAWVAFGSFGSVMLATYLDKVGEAAVLRETSTVFAALIGWLVLKERVGPTRMIFMTLIALGAVFVEILG